MNLRHTLEQYFIERWYGAPRELQLLRPLAAAYGIGQHVRAQRAERNAWRAPVPVIVVGNLTVGGTGKTPVVRWLVQALERAGMHPGVVMRGYGARVSKAMVVSKESDPRVVGDESAMLVSKAGCPVAVHRSRRQAIEALLAVFPCNVLVFDDGLQHRSVARDFEIVVMDGQRGVGNGQLLPVGPLREPASRLQTVDYVMINDPEGNCARPPTQNCLTFELKPNALTSLAGSSLPLTALSGRRVHVVAGIGHFSRFREQVERLGAIVDARPLADHHRYDGKELLFNDLDPIVTTEKDAVKLRRLPGSVERPVWVLDGVVSVIDGDESMLFDRLRVLVLGSRLHE